MQGMRRSTRTQPGSQHAIRIVAALVVLAIGAILATQWRELGTRESDAPAPPARVTSSVSIGALRLVAPGELPAEARRTIVLIAAGGPFPHQRDGSVFENRERLLPARPAGYYHEYTVPTPGEHDRGARRLVTGKGGELYYTGDHYASFVQVQP
jgi:ribonuclease T1